ncbi:MAG: hypothetical protein ACREDO_08090 [Methyloceanibacter sp.]
MSWGRLRALLAAILLGGLIGAIVNPNPVRAEFEIQESEIEKGEIELEYRGAVHQGIPSAGEEEKRRRAARSTPKWTKRHFARVTTSKSNGG